ncbi:hypothetical protein [Merismopedia glauca]|nr:hypothetical protein [Merismopedia glauca]
MSRELEFTAEQGFHVKLTPMNPLRPYREFMRSDYLVNWYKLRSLDRLIY